MRQSGRRSRLYASCAVALTLVTGTALGFAPRVPGLGSLPALPGTSPLDYLSRPAGRLAPLSARFIAQVLGINAEREIARGNRPTETQFIAPASPLAAGPERLTDVHPLTNDNIANARYIPAIPFTAKTDTRKATRETSEPDDCGPVGQSTVWYRYRPARNIGLIANTFGTDYSTTLGVFAGRPGTLKGVGCDTDARGNAIVPFAAKKNTTYFFQIVGPAGGGDMVFNLDPHGSTRMTSVSPTGQKADTTAEFPSISGDGRLVAFQSDASNLVPGAQPFPPIRPPPRGEETNRQTMWPYHIFVRDLRRASTMLVDVDASGRPGNGYSTFPFISGNGRYVAFRSTATNLVPKDTNGGADIFVHDLVTRRTELASISTSGEQVRQPVLPRPRDAYAVDHVFLWSGEAVVSPTLSWDGRYVAFESQADNLVPGDTNGVPDVFVRDRARRRTERVSVASTGREQTRPNPSAQRGGCSAAPIPDAPHAVCDRFMDASISGNGRFVSFRSPDDELVADDANGRWDVFVHDRLMHTTERVSVSMRGRPDGEASDGSFPPRQALSFDGRFVAFSAKRDLVGDGSTDGTSEVYVRDRLKRTTVLASVTSAGEPAQPPFASEFSAISADGRYVAFQSAATNLGTREAFQGWDLFVHDLVTRTTIVASIEAEGQQMQADSWIPSISADGRAVAFSVTDVDLVGNVTDRTFQVYVFERTRSGS